MTKFYETQEEKSDIPIIVGIEDVRTKIRVDGKVFIPTISLKINTLNNRGIHMSRLVESLTESINNIASGDSLLSLTNFCLFVHDDLKKRHPFDYFDLTLNTELAVETQTPASNKLTIEVHDISIRLKEYNGKFEKTLSVKVIGASACPHAYTNNKKGRTHIQRSQIELSHTCGINYDITHDELINICNNSFSSPVYTLLKTEDEQAVIDSMFDNPYFVEDEMRNVIKLSREIIKEGKVSIRVVNFESIHRHNVVAEQIICLDK